MQDAQVLTTVPLSLSPTLSTTIKHHRATVTSRARHNHKLEKISGCVNWKSSKFNQLENGIRIFVEITIEV